VVKISTQGVATLALYLKALRTKSVKIVLCKIENFLGIVATRKNHTLVNLDYLVLKAHNITSLLYFTTFSNFSQQKRRSLSVFLSAKCKVNAEFGIRNAKGASQ
jgi:hypothetical protein